MKVEFLIVWVLFIGALIFLSFFFTKRVKQNKLIRQKLADEYEEKKRKYKYLREGILDECPREDILTAAIIHCMRKEDEDFDNYFDKMNESEKDIYGIYQLTLTLQGQGASLHSFFLSPSTKLFVPIVDRMFNDVGAYELADLVKAARRFAEIIENDEDDEDDEEMGVYSRYNFSDFTNEFLTLASTTNLSEKMTDFIIEHKEDFYDHDIDETNEEEVEDNEGTSN